MKKALYIVLTFVLTLILIACAVNSTSLYSVSTLNENSDVDEYKYVFSERNYDYLQLTDSQLQSDTATLLDLVLNSGHINPWVSSSPGYPGYSAVRANFNGLQELEKRADAGTVMVYRYLEESLKLTCGYYGNSVPMVQLYALLIQDAFVNKLTTKETLVFNIADKCYHNQIKWRIVTASSYYAN